jgi:three-Cys-motif partner protein
MRLEVSNKQLSIFDGQQEDSESYFASKRDWSASKHRIMLRYIQAFCYNLGGTESFQSPYLNYVDGFAGTGSYGKGLGIEDFVGSSNFWKKHSDRFSNTDGSPLIALRCAQIFKEENRVDLRCFFTEAKKKFNEQLRENCKSLGEGLFYKVYEPQTFEEALPKIMLDLENYPTLFFLDTFGVVGFTFEHICSIADYVSQYKGELFFLYHNIQVARHAGKTTGKSDEPRTQQANENYAENLTTLLGPASDDVWRPKWRELRGQPQQFEKWLLEYFKYRIRSETRFKGVVSFEIKETYHDARPQYHLVACSNHPQKAFGYFLNEFACEENRLLFFGKDKAENVLKFLEKEWTRTNKERIAEIKPKVIEILQKENRSWISFEDTITSIILKVDTFGYLKRTQYYRDILIPLHKEGVIEVKDLGAKGEPTLKSKLRIVQSY